MKKIYKISKEQLLSCKDANEIIDINLVIEKFKLPIHIVKKICRENKLRFNHQMTKKNVSETIQCPCCTWSGNFKFSTHLLNSQNEDHKKWIQHLIELYINLKSIYKISGLEEIKKYKISSDVIQYILTKLHQLAKNNITEYHCPKCEWKGKFHFQKHIRDSNDSLHDEFKKDIMKKYVEEEMTPYMIAKIYNVSDKSIKGILKDLNVTIRNQRESTDVAMKKNRHHIHNFGIKGKRKDLNDDIYYKSMNEANFARVLQYNKIKYEYEKSFDIKDETGKIIANYHPDFLVSESQAFEIKGFKEKNDDFKNRKKTILFIKQYPNVKLKVIFCDSQEWKTINEKYSKLIPLWETKSKNLKENPEIYDEYQNN